MANSKRITDNDHDGDVINKREEEKRPYSTCALASQGNKLFRLATTFARPLTTISEGELIKLCTLLIQAPLERSEPFYLHISIWLLGQARGWQGSSRTGIMSWRRLRGGRVSAPSITQARRQPALPFSLWRMQDRSCVSSP